MSAATLERDLEKYRPVPTVLMEPPRSFDVELSEENDLSEQKSLSTGYFHTFSHHRSIEAGSFLGELFVATSQVAELVREAALQTSSGVVRLADTRLTVARWDLGDHTKGLNEILPRTMIARTEEASRRAKRIGFANWRGLCGLSIEALPNTTSSHSWHRMPPVEPPTNSLKRNASMKPRKPSAKAMGGQSAATL